MKITKLLSLMLCLVMLMTTALTGCEKKDEEKADDQNLKLVTLNMFIVTDDETTEEQKQSVEIAINEITIKDLKTKLNINFLKEEEYWATIEQTLADIDAYEEAKKIEKENKKKADKEAKAEETKKSKKDKKAEEEEEARLREEMAPYIVKTID